MSLMVSISGVRGIVGSSLTPEVIVKYTSAFAEYCSKGTIVIGRDGRITGKPIAHIVASTLVSMGCDVVAIGVCPTPTVQLAIEKAKAAGGISITASHNPIAWNGLKFLSSKGLFLDSEENKELWRIAGRPDRAYSLWDKLGSHRADDSFIDHHIREILELPYLNVKLVKKRRFKVVLDCVNGAGGIMLPTLLRKMGCVVNEMNCDVSGVFSHPPEPVPENLTALCKKVRSEKADLGIAVDPDVDRLVLIDERGEPLGEEYTVASVVKFVLEKESRNRKRNLETSTVVVNLSTTRAIDDIAAEFGARCVRTPVGEINVAKKMKELGALVGGEGSGGVILPRIHLGRDAPVGIGLTLQHLAEFGAPLSHLKKSLPQYFITKGKVEVGTIKAENTFRELKEKYAHEGRLNTDDGLKIDFAGSWVHLRMSNTEPIVRIIAEAPSKTEANDMVQRFTQEILKGGQS